MGQKPEGWHISHALPRKAPHEPFESAARTAFSDCSGSLRPGLSQVIGNIEGFRNRSWVGRGLVHCLAGKHIFADCGWIENAAWLRATI
jgi:hypothetical protein